MPELVVVPEDYEFVRIINSGGFGSVVEIVEKSSQIHYAGKMIQNIASIDHERIEREVGRLRQFNHPAIVKLKEVVSMVNTYVIIMELGGQSLAEIVKGYTERKVLIVPGQTR
ncbi:hypothetical protein BLNAU_10584 [Blattamonas nauphoetae]|uniref:Protein kinase domain-containing protein n=1 Tax=Blattamonas nauphoetae TaxID=2049346 RepID=A0ABQ9XT00_9EUKA|nr:hypothetical protein BLNAU_10584 [Blattamonas nauphoetae]